MATQHLVTSDLADHLGCLVALDGRNAGDDVLEIVGGLCRFYVPPAPQNPGVWRQVKTPSAGFLDDRGAGVSRAIGWIALEMCDLESVFPVLCVSLRIVRILFPVESLVITGMIHVIMVDIAGVRCHN